MNATMSAQPPIPKTALVVDDSMLIRHTVCRFLEERGFIVESATNGVEALEVLNNFVHPVRPLLYSRISI